MIRYMLTCLGYYQMVWENASLEDCEPSTVPTTSGIEWRAYGRCMERVNVLGRLLAKFPGVVLWAMRLSKVST